MMPMLHLLFLWSRHFGFEASVPGILAILPTATKSSDPFFLQLLTADVILSFVASSSEVEPPRIAFLPCKSALVQLTRRL